jgi:hypothetical protein
VPHTRASKSDEFNSLIRDLRKFQDIFQDIFQAFFQVWEFLDAYITVAASKGSENKTTWISFQRVLELKQVVNL